MPETTAQPSDAARKGAAAHKARELKREQEEHERLSGRTDRPDRRALRRSAQGARVRVPAAIAAVRKSVDVGDGVASVATWRAPARRREIVDAAMDMADRLVKTQYEFLRSVVQDAATAVSLEEDEK